MAPPYSLNDTAIVLNIELVPALITSLAPTFPDIQTASDVTVFVPRIGANSGSTGDRVPADFIGTAEYVGSYVVSGEVLYSTNLTAGTHIKTTANTTLIVSRDTNGSISVNGSRIVEPDILTQNGVVHIIEG